MNYLVIAFMLVCVNAFGQKAKPYKCAFITKDFKEVKFNYNTFFKFLNVKKGESVASIGASSGYVEVQVAAIVDSVNWTLQDIDTSCLSKTNFEKLLRYHEKLKGSFISGEFKLVAGTIHQTNLAQNAFDRILMINVYHEISDRKSIMNDIKAALKPDGEIVLMERMGTKHGQKHGDCGLTKLWEPEFLDEMEEFGFNQVHKDVPVAKFPSMVYYTFKKNISAQ